MSSWIKRETTIMIRQRSSRAARPIEADHTLGVSIQGYGFGSRTEPSAFYAVRLTLLHVPSVDCVPSSGCKQNSFCVQGHFARFTLFST